MRVGLHGIDALAHPKADEMTGNIDAPNVFDSRFPLDSRAALGLRCRAWINPLGKAKPSGFKARQLLETGRQ